MLDGNLLQKKNSKRLKKIAEKHKLLKDIHPDLAGHYRLGQLSGQIILWLTSKGKLADQINSDRALKLAFDLNLIRKSDGEQLCLRPFPADILIEGPLYERLIRAIVKQENDSVGFDFSHKVLGHQNNPLDLFDEKHRPDVINFFKSGEFKSSSTFFRIQRIDDNKDREIALIRGNVIENKPAWFIFQIKIKNFSGEKPTLKKIKYLAGFNGDGRYYPKDRQDIPDSLLAYLTRVIRTLNAWDRSLGNVEER